MPMGIGGYPLYVKLCVSAPELQGKWGVAPLPGHKKEDGTIDRSVAGIAGEASIILSQTTKKESAWKFLKWWTSAKTQSEFGREIESLVGTEAKWNTANVEAFESMPWDREHLTLIKEQWKWYKEIPVVLGGYFTSRHIVNAWTNVVLSDSTSRETPRDALEKAVNEINRELRRKQEEYGFYIQ